MNSLLFMKNLLKKKPFYPIIKYVQFLLKRKHQLQKINISSKYNFITLGSKNAAWTFIDKKELYESTIISAGLGEDGSFDIEFARKYNANIIIVDPTPRALKHYNEIISRLGLKNTIPYIDKGKQFKNAYNLENIESHQLKLINKALWNNNKKTVRFYKPKNLKNVSHSIINYQNKYLKNTSNIKVESITIMDLLKENNLDKNKIKFLKLDIEGAEIEVIINMLENHFKPNQICVEFDELNIKLTDKAIKRIDKVDKILKKNGYKCLYTDRIANFLYAIEP